ncbi:triose-phosphate isomerase [bacterium]|nr:MAG: triose-phosphate isomerase [bacterium]
MMKPRPLIIGNWKMNPRTISEARKLFDMVKKEAESLRKTDIVMCPPSVFIGDPALCISERGFFLGAQNMFFEEDGAYTGEISGSMLKSLSVKYLIVGHSERRAMGESDEIVSKKVLSGIKTGFTVILCVGEKERDHESAYLQTLKEQIIASLYGVPKKSLGKIVIAYEPIWAIGEKAKGAIDPGMLLEIIIFIRKVLNDIYGQTVAHSMRFLYGGSVDEKNAADFLTEGGVMGLLVGRASLSAKKFIEIIKIAENI